MFIVFNKQKIYSYLIALSTVVILFVITFAVTNNPNDVVQTSTNLQENNIIENQVNGITKNIENQTNIIQKDRNIESQINTM